MPGWVIAVIVIASVLLWALVAKIQWEVWKLRCRKVRCYWNECAHCAGGITGVSFWPVTFPILLIVMGVDAFVARRKSAARPPRQTRAQRRLAKIAARQAEIQAKLELAKAKRELKAYEGYPAHGKALR